MRRRQSLVGEPINFRGMVYAPVNEGGVVYLFAKVAEELGFIVEEIRAAYPDCTARRRTGKALRRVHIEFEFTSANFQQHGHDPTDCDLIVCWEHDWPECPLEVIELRQVVRALSAKPSARPDRKLAAVFRRKRTPEALQEAYFELERRLLEIVHSASRVGHCNGVTFYLPEGEVSVWPAQRHVMFTVFTGGRPLAGVKPVPGGSHPNWGLFHVHGLAEVEAAIAVVKEHLRRLTQARKRGEDTAW